MQGGGLLLLRALLPLPLRLQPPALHLRQRLQEPLQGRAPAQPQSPRQFALWGRPTTTRSQREQLYPVSRVQVSTVTTAQSASPSPSPTNSMTPLTPQCKQVLTAN